MLPSSRKGSITQLFASPRGRRAAALFSLVGAVGALAAFTRPPLTPIATRKVPQTVIVRGHVRSADTQRPIEGVVIAVSGTPVSALTDRSGAYRLLLPGRPRGTALQFSARRSGYATAQRTVSITTDSLVVDFTLNAAAVVADAANELSRVTGAARGLPVSAGATIASPAPSVVGPTMSRAKLSASRDERRIRERDASVVPDPSREGEGNREQYDRINDNPFLSVVGNPRSTFSVDVDRSSYGNVRRFLTQGQLPPADAVRIEELVNYFPYSLDEPRGDAPVAITTEAMPAPWQPKHHLVRIALQARRIDLDRLPPSNLVFLIDVSGSMSSPDKLPLVKESLRLLVAQLREEDHVAIVVYAGAAGLVLPSTPGNHKARIMESIDRLEAGGSTAGGAGLELAYRTAREHFERGGNNRVILATDGDFNVGPSSDAAMERLIESKRAEGTYLTILGFGTGNYQDAKMQKLARVGNGNAAYVDDISEARKVLVKEMGGTLVTVANDVKLQIEFNPAHVASYRLIGYEDRLLRDEDFRDDKKDAGDMGAGHSVTALYEVVPVGVRGTVPVRTTDPLRYHAPVEESAVRRAADGELLHVSLRYKKPGESTSRLLGKSLDGRSVRESASDDFTFAASVAAFGMLLRDSEYKGTTTASSVLSLARSAAADDEDGYRREFIGLVERWRTLARGVANVPRER
ncbi:MAG: von Willebrand factor type A domain-containing protein [Gemmatimonadaceae bacterium]|nr:von Willebrand factor type A domain-containing protein [Gemmatimonadaceae bacterium]